MSKEEQFRQMMAQFAQQQGQQLLELEKELPPLSEQDRLCLLEAANQAGQQAEAQKNRLVHPHYWRRYAAAAALALLAGSTALLGDAQALQDAMGQIQIRQTYNGNICFGLPQQQWDEWSNSQQMEGRYAPTWLPEGYEPIEQSKGQIENYDSLAYSQTDYYQLGTILFQRFSTYALTQFTEEKENTQIVWVGENKGALTAREWHNSTDYTLTWYDPEAKSYFCLRTDRITREELFAIADSIKRID